MQDPYTTLGVARDASEDDIRRAYRKLAKKNHPDLNPGNAAAEERFKAIASANELLSDATKRGRFDRGEIDASGQDKPPQPSYRDFADGEAGRRYARSERPSEAWTTDDLGGMFGEMFDRERRAGGSARRPGRDELYALTADFLEAVNGTTRRLTLPDGRVLDVTIPPGTSEGQVLRLRGQGAEGRNGGSTGDALIEIHVAPHRFYSRDDRDLALELPVTLSEAVLGAQVTVPTPGGPVLMRIPPHSDSGARLRLRGRGVPAHGGHPAGDLHATLRVVIGGADAALDAFLRDWKPEHPTDPRQTMEASP